ncbi:MAG TPA: hypothetical protein PLY36_14620 [Spirochaetota bacterium]|nr:hypothetical protein [Spirochaetota bacterium]
MKLFKFTAIVITSIILIYSDASAISVSVRSSKDYYYTTRILREMKPMITNFKTDENQKSMDSLMKNFEEATLEHYGTNYDSSALKYYNLKLEIIKVLESVCTQYIDRTKEILTATSIDNNTIEIFITYDKNSGYATYFNKPFDPLRDVKPYDDKFTAKDYHFFFDSQKVESYLRNGHFNYNEAKKFFNDPEIAFIKSRKRIKTDQLNYIIDRYITAIQFCRMAKQSALEIYKVKNEFNTGAIQDKYKLRKDQITPIFDDRIPEKFKVDAIDNIKMLYPVELERRKKFASQIN